MMWYGSGSEAAVQCAVLKWCNSVVKYSLSSVDVVVVAVVVQRPSVVVYQSRIAMRCPLAQRGAVLCEKDRNLLKRWCSVAKLKSTCVVSVARQRIAAGEHTLATVGRHILRCRRSYACKSPWTLLDV